MNPMGPHIDTELVTRNIIARSRRAFLRFDSSISPLKWPVNALDDHIAAAIPIAKRLNEKMMSHDVTPSSLKLAAPQR
jgi:hypothetical protein